MHIYLNDIHRYKFTLYRFCWFHPFTFDTPPTRWWWVQRSAHSASVVAWDGGEESAISGRVSSGRWATNRQAHEVQSHCILLHIAAIWQHIFNILVMVVRALAKAFHGYLGSQRVIFRLGLSQNLSAGQIPLGQCVGGGGQLVPVSRAERSPEKENSSSRQRAASLFLSQGMVDQRTICVSRAFRVCKLSAWQQWLWSVAWIRNCKGQASAKAPPLHPRRTSVLGGAQPDWALRSWPRWNVRQMPFRATLRWRGRSHGGRLFGS